MKIVPEFYIKEDHPENQIVFFCKELRAEDRIDVNDWKECTCRLGIKDMDELKDRLGEVCEYFIKERQYVHFTEIIKQ